MGRRRVHRSAGVEPNSSGAGRCLKGGGNQGRVCRPAAAPLRPTYRATPARPIVRLLLDTCAFLWLAGGSELSDPAAAAIRDPSNEVLLSAVSTWEIASKYRAGRLPLPEPPDQLIPTE